MTPLKWPGLDCPSNKSENFLTSTEVVNPSGYISSSDGQNTKSTPSCLKKSKSWSIVLGYEEKSSWFENCIGFVKIVTTTI